MPSEPNTIAIIMIISVMMQRDGMLYNIFAQWKNRSNHNRILHLPFAILIHNNKRMKRMIWNMKYINSLFQWEIDEKPLFSFIHFHFEFTSTYSRMVRLTSLTLCFRHSVHINTNNINNNNPLNFGWYALFSDMPSFLGMPCHSMPWSGNSLIPRWN